MGRFLSVNLCHPFILVTFKNAEKGFSSPSTCCSCGITLITVSLHLPCLSVSEGSQLLHQESNKAGEFHPTSSLLAAAVYSCPHETTAHTLLDTASYSSHFPNVQVFMLSSWLGPSNLAIPSTTATASSLKTEASISGASLLWMRISHFQMCADPLHLSTFSSNSSLVCLNECNSSPLLLGTITYRTHRHTHLNSVCATMNSWHHSPRLFLTSHKLLTQRSVFPL